MRERREVAARADRSARGDVRQDAAVETFEQQLDRRDVRAGEPLCERVRAQEHRRADDVVRIRLADAARMAAQEAELELLAELLRDVSRDEPAEAGVHAVRVLALDPVDEGSRGPHALLRRAGEGRRQPIDRDRPHVGNGEVLSRQDDRTGHSASLERSTRSRTRDSSTPGSSTPAARAASTTRSGTSPTSSPATTSVPRARASARTRSTTSCKGAASTSMTFMLTCVRRDRGRRRPDRLDAGHPSARPSDGDGDGIGDPEILRREVEVVRDQRMTRADEDSAGPGVELVRAGIRDELRRVDSPRELLQAATAEEDRPSTVRRVAVEKHRQPKLVADSSGEHVRSRDSPPEVRRLERDERHDVRDTDTRVSPDVLAQVDALDGDADPGEERFDQPVLVPDERVDGPVMVGVGVDVEQRGVSLERLTDGADDAGVAALGDVGHGLEHDPYPTKPCPTTSHEAPRTAGGARSCASSASSARTAPR